MKLAWAIIRIIYLKLLVHQITLQTDIAAFDVAGAGDGIGNVQVAGKAIDACSGCFVCCFCVQGKAAAIFGFQCLQRFAVGIEDIGISGGGKGHARVLGTLDIHVAVVPGTAFGECGEGFIRISYAASMETIEKAMDKMEKYIKSLK